MPDPTGVNTDPFEAQVGAPRKEVVAGSVNPEEKATILLSLAQGGFRNASEGVREIVLAYRDSAEVRDVIHRHLRQRAA